MSICYLVGAMETRFPIRKKPGDFVIAADGGYRSLLSLGVKPDLVVGDFDSLGYEPKDVECIRHSVKKDDTDMMLAAREGLARGYDRFMLVGGLGGRLDQTIANIHILSYLAEKGARGVLAGQKENALVVKNAAAEFHAGQTGTVSVFAWGGPAKGVTIEGLEYCLKDAVLDCGMPLGVSNTFIGEAARISVKDGSLLVIWSGGIDKMVRL